MNIFDKKKFAIGLDIGAHYTKAVVLEYKSSKKSIKIHSTKQAVTPLNVIVNGEIIDKSKITNFLEEFFREMPINNNTFVSITVNMLKKKSTIKNMTLLDVKNKEMEQAIEEMVEEELGIGSKNDLYYNWGKQRKIDNTHVNVLLCGIRRENIDPLIGVLEDMKLKPYHAEPTVLSSLRALNFKERESEILIDIGGSYIEISGINKGSLIYSRTIELGTHNLLNLTAEYIEKNEINIGDNTIDSFFNKLLSNIEDLDEEIKANKEPSKNQFLISLKEETELILERIIETIEFYQNHYEINMKKLFVIGGGVRFQFLVNMLETYSNKKVIIGKPYFWKYLSDKEKNNFEYKISTFTPVIGVALKEVENNV